MYGIFHLDFRGLGVIGAIVVVRKEITLGHSFDCWQHEFRPVVLDRRSMSQCIESLLYLRFPNSSIVVIPYSNIFCASSNV